jgi:hypothetical protein
MAANDVQALTDARDARAIKVAATNIAQGDSADEHARLGEQLAEPAFLDRLDPPAEKAVTYTDLRLTRVLDVLGNAHRPSADAVLLKLTDAAPYHNNPLRMQALIRALAGIKPAPRPAIAYWDRWSKPGSSLAFNVAEALCMNESAPAMDLLERKLADPKHELDQKKAWLQQLVLPRRNDQPLLACCERVVKGAAAEDVKIAVVEALFDYDLDWYRGCDPPTPPERALLTREARQLTTAIGEYALEKLKPSPALRGKVEATLRILTRT